MWCHVSSKSLATLPAAVWRCGRILVALSVGLLMLGFYWDAAREAQVPEQQNYPGQEDVLDQENNGESRGSTPLSAGSQNDDALGSYAFMEGKFKGGEDVPNNVLKDYSGTKSEEDLELYLEEEILKMDLDSLITSKTSPPTTTTTTTSAPPPATTTTSPTNHKTILFYSKFFSNPWSGFLSRRTSLMHKCPVSTCVFLENSTHPEDADAVIFHALDFRPESVPARRRPDQLYVWLTLEAPAWDEYGHGLQRLKPNYKILQTVEKRFGRPGLFNWTSTYHRESDVMLPYGGFLPLEGE